MREFALTSNAATTTTGLTVAGATTLNFINPAAAPSMNIEYLRHWVGQAANATSAQQRIQTATQVTAFPTLTSRAPVAKKKADPNASVIAGGTAGAAGTSGINASAEGAGTKTQWDIDDDFNVLNGYLHVYGPAETSVLPAGSTSGCNLWFPTAPSTLTGWSWGQVFREV
jgi:phage I-like protein